MRLIDEIAYQEKIAKIPIEERTFVKAWETAQDMPTIDAVPMVRGEWIVTKDYPHRVYCSLCHKTNVLNEEWLFEKNEYPKFCMWCGAKMDSEKEGV